MSSYVADTLNSTVEVQTFQRSSSLDTLNCYRLDTCNPQYPGRLGDLHQSLYYSMCALVNRRSLDVTQTVQSSCTVAAYLHVLFTPKSTTVR